MIASGEKWGRGPQKDVHSSLKAMIDSPAWRLVQALQTLVTPDGNTPAIDGWFENVRPLTDREKTLIREAAKGADEAAEKQALGVKTWIDNLSYDNALIRLAQEPTVNIEAVSYTHLDVYKRQPPKSSPAGNRVTGCFSTARC